VYYGLVHFGKNTLAVFVVQYNWKLMYSYRNKRDLQTNWNLDLREIVGRLNISPASCFISQMPSIAVYYTYGGMVLDTDIMINTE